jgi:ATP-dependent Lon protease
VDFGDTLTTGLGDFFDIEVKDIPDELPMMAVRDVVVFNYMIIPLFVGRPASVAAINEAMLKDKLLLLATQKDSSVDEPGADDIYKVGMVCMIMRTLKLPDGRLKVLVQALCKARVDKLIQEDPYFIAKITTIDEIEPEVVTVEHEALMRSVRENTEKILSLKGIMSSDLMVILNNIEEPGRLADLIVSNLRLKIPESQSVLETIDSVARLTKVSEYLRKELEVSTVQAKIESDAKDEMNKSQREYYLREQLQALKKELGDVDDRSEEIEEIRLKLKKVRMSKEVRKEGLKQLRRFEMMHPDASEATIVRTYLDWLIEVPWKKGSKDKLDLKHAKEVLDADHYGLDKIKERILEYLAVRKLSKNPKGPILCFVGPPGVGKTSLGQSIAKAIGRKFYRLSLGGMHDEAEIRGHRRTYIGAMPGRIIQGLKTVGTNNPVFMMDEVDKVGTDYRGDPSSALLEVLDPEQNFSFSDHYLNLPYDLSKVMFIVTANMTDTIPSPLLDRMEVIRLTGYTLEEKLVIAKRYLMPRQIKENGIKVKHFTLSDKILEKIITHYTREAGLRNLEREIGKICRKVARRVAEGGKGPYAISDRTLISYLGPPKLIPESETDTLDQPGLAIGLAWTEVGGEILCIEVSILKGKGKIIMTGQLGDVMKESAQAALSYCRTKLDDLKLPDTYFEEIDIHIHVPAGAIPKDGPSAGVTMATALYSALSGKRVRNDIAMTGEITLRGRVLPIGGLKEKALAALRVKIKTIFIPEENKKDLIEIPPEIRKKLKFVPVKSVDEIFKMAFVKG